MLAEAVSKVGQRSRRKIPGPSRDTSHQGQGAVFSFLQVKITETERKQLMSWGR